MKKFKALAAIALAAVMTASVFTGCSGSSADNKSTGATGAAKAEAPDTTKSEPIDYMVLVNKTNPLPDTWEDKLETIHTTNSIGDTVEVEKKAYDAYLNLKQDLVSHGIHVDLDSARRSVKEQQKIMDDFTKKYGAEYAAKTVAKPGYSEHHTGLALDLYLIIDGKDVVENEDMIKYKKIWAEIHKKLAKYGFILRYLEGKEHITGYGYEPWHIRYVENGYIAKNIKSKELTLEEYLGKAKGGKVDIDYGTSSIYSKKDLEDAVIQLKCDFANFEGCKLHNIRYAGDSEVNDANLKWVNEKNPDAKYTKVAKFLTDFKSRKGKKNSTLESNHEYKDYQWWLARTDKDGWEVVSKGY